MEIVHTIAEGMEMARAQCEVEGREEMFVAGGAGVYEACLPLASRLYLTQVHADVQGDTYFPEFDMAQWHIVRSEDHAQDEKNSFAFTIMLLERVDGS